MEKEKIIETLNGILTEEFEVELSHIVPNASVKETLDLDSLDYVDLVVLIDNHFGFKVTQEDFGKIITFEDFCNFIEKKLGK